MPPLHYSITPPLRLLFLVFIHNFKIGVDHVVTALPATPRSSAVGPLAPPSGCASLREAACLYSSPLIVWNRFCRSSVAYLMASTSSPLSFSLTFSIASSRVCF
jgi:hypothetical protein